MQLSYEVMKKEKPPNCVSTILINVNVLIHQIELYPE